jgi:hypothetical protein
MALGDTMKGCYTERVTAHSIAYIQMAQKAKNNTFETFRPISAVADKSMSLRQQSLLTENDPEHLFDAPVLSDKVKWTQTVLIIATYLDNRLQMPEYTQ